MQKKTSFVALALVTLATFALVACGGGAQEAPPAEEGAGEPEAVTVNVTLGEFFVEMDTTEIPVGVPVTFNITNEGAVEHEVVLEAFGVVDEPLEGPDGEEAEAEDIEPGDTSSFTFTFEEDGAFQLACHIPGHYEAGMVTGFAVGEAEVPSS